MPQRQINRTAATLRTPALTILLIAAVVTAVGCQPAPQADNDSDKDKVGAQASQTPGGTFGSGAYTPAPEDKNMKYPSYEFVGSGMLTAYNNNSIANAIKFSLTSEDIIFETTSFTSTDGTVNAAVNSLVGKKTVKRSTDQEVQDWFKRTGNENPGFIIFSKSSIQEDKNGKVELTFSQPMPTYIAHTNPDQFKIFDSGSLYFNGIEVTDVGAKIKFHVDVRIDRRVNTAEYITLKTTYKIPEDANGSLYGRFFLPHQTTVKIDLTKKQTQEIRTFSWYHNGHEKIREIRPITLISKLCKIVSPDGSVEEFCK